jgi:hypothetical protein
MAVYLRECAEQICDGSAEADLFGVHEWIAEQWRKGQIAIRGRPLLAAMPDRLGEVVEIHHHPDLTIHWFEGKGREPRVYQKPNGRGMPVGEWRELAIAEADAARLKTEAGLCPFAATFTRNGIEASVPLYRRDGLPPSPEVMSPGPKDRAEDEAPTAPRKRGPKNKTRESVAARMRLEIQSGEMTWQDLDRMLEKQMAAKYNVCRDTARKARANVLGAPE